MSGPGAGDEQCTVQFGRTTIAYTLRRSRRRKKTIGITLDHGGVFVAVPIRTSREQIREAVLKRAGWILRKSADQAVQPRRKEFVGGETLPYLGTEIALFVEHANIRRPTIALEDCGFRVAVPAALGRDGEERHKAVHLAVVGWYRARAAERLDREVERWARAMSLNPTRVLIRDQRRRWGSCSHDGTLRFNWRIVMAPPAIIDYLVVHELLHLRIKNHSASYWAEFARLMPDCKARRRLLRGMGPRLRV